MISFYYRSVREEQLKKSKKFRVGSWIAAEEPTREELEQLSADYGLDADLLNDALDPDEIPRSQSEGDVVYVYMRYAYRRGDSVETDPVLLAIGPKFVASISRRPLPSFERLTGSKDMVTTQRAKLLLQLLRHMVLTYDLSGKILDRQIRAVRTRLSVANIGNRDFVQFVTIEDALNSFLSDLVPAHLVLQTLLSGRHKLTFYEEDKDLIEDLVQDARQLVETSRSSLRTIVNIREAYSNIMTNNLNRRVELLTAITVVLTVPTIVFSLWGVNVAVPGQHSPHAFVFLLLGTILAMAAILFVLLKKRWF